jgi:hypothetical protein
MVVQEPDLPLGQRTDDSSMPCLTPQTSVPNLLPPTHVVRVFFLGSCYISTLGSYISWSKGWHHGYFCHWGALAKAICVLLDCYSYNLKATQYTTDSCRLGQAHWRGDAENVHSIYKNILMKCHEFWICCGNIRTIVPLFLSLHCVAFYMIQ